MGITRRGFLGCVAGSLTAGLSLDLRWSVDAGPRRVLLDLGEHCGLRESVAGYESALAGLGTGATSRCTLLIVPAALDIPPPAVGAIMSCLRTGATVLLESGAGFATARDFRAHRAVLRDRLGVHIEAPVRLWSSGARGAYRMSITAGPRARRSAISAGWCLWGARASGRVRSSRGWMVCPWPSSAARDAET